MNFLFLKLDNPFVKILSLKKMAEMSVHSQFGQDRYVLNVFFSGKNKSGIFCDVGGNHPITINNTYMFEKMG